MRYLGIDYGTKRVGIAVSDENGQFAMVHSVLPNDRNTLAAIAELCRERSVGEIVLGESRDFKGKPNPVMKEIAEFKTTLEKATGLAVHLEPEFMTSAEAERLQGKTDKLDASAAALILKSYLDKLAQKNEK